MKTIAKKISLPLCAGVALGLFAVNARAIEVDGAAKSDASCCANVEAKPETKHGLKIVHRAEAHADHLATMLTQHTKKIADKTEEATTRAVGHMENVAHKVGDVAKKVSDKVQKKIDNLSE
jgi:acyl-CoA reductase-like NAD-dependent aldehyde dehydrogenase